MYLGTIANSHGTPIDVHTCETCGDTFTVCPAGDRADDDQWRGCLSRACASYDPNRDADWFFDDGNVLSFSQRSQPRAINRRAILQETNHE